MVVIKATVLQGVRKFGHFAKRCRKAHDNEDYQWCPLCHKMAVMRLQTEIYADINWMYEIYDDYLLYQKSTRPCPQNGDLSRKFVNRSSQILIPASRRTGFLLRNTDESMQSNRCIDANVSSTKDSQIEVLVYSLKSSRSKGKGDEEMANLSMNYDTAECNETRRSAQEEPSGNSKCLVGKQKYFFNLQKPSSNSHAEAKYSEHLRHRCPRLCRGKVKINWKQRLLEIVVFLLHHHHWHDSELFVRKKKSLSGGCRPFSFGVPQLRPAVSWTQKTVCIAKARNPHSSRDYIFGTLCLKSLVFQFEESLNQSFTQRCTKHAVVLCRLSIRGSTLKSRSMKSTSKRSLMSGHFLENNGWITNISLSSFPLTQGTTFTTFQSESSVFNQGVLRNLAHVIESFTVSKTPSTTPCGRSTMSDGSHQIGVFSAENVNQAALSETMSWMSELHLGERKETVTTEVWVNFCCPFAKISNVVIVSWSSVVFFVLFVSGQVREMPFSFEKHLPGEKLLLCMCRFIQDTEARLLTLWNEKQRKRYQWFLRENKQKKAVSKSDVSRASTAAPC